MMCVCDVIYHTDNPRAHFMGTGPEIWEQTDGRVTHFVSSDILLAALDTYHTHSERLCLTVALALGALGSMCHRRQVSSMGTTGTIMGTSQYLKEVNPNIEIVGLQPKEGASIAGIRRWPVEVRTIRV
jgi:cysteine synthase B